MKATAIATLRDLRVSPRKVRLLVDAIRKKTVAQALLTLQFSGKDASTPVAKLIQSAVANAEHNYGIDVDSLVIAKAFVDGGATLHRWMPRAFGRAAKIRKRTSHITVVLEGDVSEKAKKKVQKVEAVHTDEQVEHADTTTKPEQKRKNFRKTATKGGAIGAKPVSAPRTTSK